MADLPVAHAVIWLGLFALLGFLIRGNWKLSEYLKNRKVKNDD